MFHRNVAINNTNNILIKVQAQRAKNGQYMLTYGFSIWSCMDVRVGLWRKLSTEELMLLNCGVVVCWRRLLRVPWTARRSNQSILKEISPGCCLEGMMLKLKLQYFGHLIGKDSDAGRDWGQEEKGMTEDEMAGWHHWLHECESEWTPGVGDGQGGLACCDSQGHKDWVTELNWTDGTRCHDLSLLNVEF